MNSMLLEGTNAYSLLIDNKRTKAVTATEMLQEMRKCHRHLRIHCGYVLFTPINEPRNVIRIYS
jgi:hypothetical protein